MVGLIDEHERAEIQRQLYADEPHISWAPVQISKIILNRLQNSAVGEARSG
jgi:hypothetical protein